jgi:hypothetical protein
MKLYHRTKYAQAILAGGFRDSTATYGMTEAITGVWFSDVPLNEADIPYVTGDLLEIELPAEAIADFEVCYIDPVTDQPIRFNRYREWILPADLVNERGNVRLIAEEEE